MKPRYEIHSIGMPEVVSGSWPSAGSRGPGTIFGDRNGERSQV